jgi:hypothetical protein
VLLPVRTEGRPDISLDERAWHLGQIGKAIALYGVGLATTSIGKGLCPDLHEMRILSLAKRADQVNMWALYADTHRGFCLEFANEGIFRAAREVDYVDELAVDVSSWDSMRGDARERMPGARARLVGGGEGRPPRRVSRPPALHSALNCAPSRRRLPVVGSVQAG